MRYIHEKETLTVPDKGEKNRRPRSGDTMPCSPQCSHSTVSVAIKSRVVTVEGPRGM